MAPAAERYRIEVHLEKRSGAGRLRMVGELVLNLLSFGAPGGPERPAAVRIIDRMTGRTAASIPVESAVHLDDIVERLEADLERLDEASFASDWGLP